MRVYEARARAVHTSEPAAAAYVTEAPTQTGPLPEGCSQGHYNVFNVEFYFL